MIVLTDNPGLVYVQRNLQNAEQNSLLRQLDQMQEVLAQAAIWPIDTHSRNYFDYHKLNVNPQKIRASIEHYLIPSRVQPHRITRLVGDYQ